MLTEWRALWNLIYFQRKTPFNQLDVKRSDFQLQEKEDEKNRKRMSKYFGRSMVVLAMIAGILSVLALNQDNDENADSFKKKADTINKIIFFMEMGLIAFWNASLVLYARLFFGGMRSFQHHEFQKHKNYMIPYAVIMILAVFSLVLFFYVMLVEIVL